MKQIKITYSALSGGLNNGMMGYTLEFSGCTLENKTIVDVVTAISEHTRSLKRKEKPLLELLGTFPPDMNMTALLGPLHSLKYVKIIESYGEYKSWYVFGQIIRVVLSKPRWAPFTCNEIWYRTDESVEPPFIKEGTFPALYLCARKKKVYDYFVKESPNSWNMLLKTPVGYIEKVLEV
jgi:hypothetical protein